MYTKDEILKRIKMLTRPGITVIYPWQDAVIDAALWTITDPATGTAWGTPKALSWGGRGITSVPNANETARIVSDQPWDALPTLWGTNYIQRSLYVEFIMALANVANMDNTLCFFGLTPDPANDRSSNNIIGFGLNTDVLETITDNAGAETTNTTFGETLTDVNRFGIFVMEDAVYFLLNGTIIASHITNLPDSLQYLNFFIDTEAGGAGTIELGKIRVWWDDE